jgi:hypothetical protein
MSGAASSYLFKNFAVVWLANAVTSSQTTLTLAAGEGAQFPQPTGGKFFIAVLEDGRSGAREVVRVTARSGDTLTLLRAQESTTAQAFAAYSSFSARLTAGALTDLFAPKPVGLVIPFNGKVNNERVRFRLPYGTIFTAGAAGSYATASAPATAITTYSVRRQPTAGGDLTTIATAVWAIGATEGVLTLATTVEAAQGDWIDAVGPTTADLTLAVISLTLAGYRP